MKAEAKVVRAIQGACLTVCLLVSSLPTAAQSGPAPVTVVLREAAQVDSPTIKLGDLAAINGDGALATRLSEVTVGQSPRPGGEREFYLSQITARVRQAGINPETITWIAVPGKGITVRMPGTKFAAEAATGLYRQALAGKLGVDPERVTVDIVSWPEIILPEGEAPLLEIQQDAASLWQSLSTGYLHVPVEVRTGDRVVESIRPRAKVSVTVRAYVASEPVARGAEIRPESFTAVEREYSALPAGAITDAGALRNKQAARPIKAGSAVAASDLTARLLVRRGESVTVTLKQSELVLVLVGRAQSDGALGEEIKVQNPASSRIVAATVTGPGTATIQIP